MYIHIHHTHLYNWSAPSCYLSTAAFNDCYTEIMLYTVLANSQGVQRKYRKMTVTNAYWNNFVVKDASLNDHIGRVGEMYQDNILKHDSP